MMACGLSAPVAIGTSAAAFSSGSKAALSPCLASAAPSASLGAIAAWPFPSRRLQRGKVAALPFVSRAAWLGRLRDVPQRRPDGAEARVEHLVERRLQLVERDAKSLANRSVPLGPLPVNAYQRVERRLAARGDDVLDEQRRLVVRERDGVRLGEAGIQIAQLEHLIALERQREWNFHLAAPGGLLAAFFVH